MATVRNANYWQDWVNLGLGGWLFLSPSILGFAGSPGAAWNAWVVGGVVALVAIAAIARFAQWEEWINLVLGLWLIISPWVLNVAALSPGTYWNFVIIGVLVAGFAAWSLAAHRQPPRVAA